MSDVKFACPGCQRHMKVAVEYVGMPSECPDCNQKFKIPSPPGEIKFKCGGCGAKLALHESYIGTEIHCPGCQTRMVVPNPRAAAQPAAPSAPKPVTPAPQQPATAKPKAVTPAAVRPAPVAGPQSAPPGSAPRSAPPGSAAAAVFATPGPKSGPPGSGPQTMPPGSLPAAAASLTTPPDPQPPVDCPDCGGAMPADARICPLCGFNLDTGAVDDSPAKPAILAKPAGGAKPPPPPPPPPGTGRKPMMPKPSASAGGDKKPQLVFYILTGIAGLLLGASFLSAPVYNFLVMYVCFILGPISGIWPIIDAFKNSVKQGLLTLFVPLYALYYIYGVSDNRMLKAVCTATMASLLFLIIGAFALAGRGG